MKIENGQVRKTKQEIKQPTSIGLSKKDKQKALRAAKEREMTLSQYIAFLIRGN